MAVDKTLIQVQAQITVSAPDGLMNNETSEMIIEEGKSYSQTVTMSKDATQDNIKSFMDAVLTLCSGVREQMDAADLTGEAVITKKIVSNYMLINEG